MLDIDQFREAVIRPTLHYLGLHSTAAENLLLGTAVQESRLKYLKQIGGGPALGVFQIEPATHKDVWDNFLEFRPDLASKVRGIASQRTFFKNADSELMFNLRYSAAIARLIYLRAPAKLPRYDDIEGLARYWKTYYNTTLGAGTTAEFILNYREHIK